MGLLGVKYVDLFLSWSCHYQKPCRTLTALILDTIVILSIQTTRVFTCYDMCDCVYYLVVGTTPYVDNFAHIGGFVIGTTTAFIIIPYIKYLRHDRVSRLGRRWQCGRVMCCVVVFLPLLLSLFLIGFIVFYQTQNTEFCSWCHYINCIPYVKGFCEEGFSSLVEATKNW